jgi:hypothetical protein
MKNIVSWDVTPCGFCKNLRFGGSDVSPKRLLQDSHCGTSPEDGILRRKRLVS